MIYQKLILIKNRNEVRRVFLTEFDAKKQRELDRRDAREEGRQEGRQESEIVLLIKKIKKGQNLDQIADALETSPEELKEMYDAVIAAAPEYDVKKIYQMLILIPYLISTVIVSYIVYGFLNTQNGFINNSILEPLGKNGIAW